MAISEENKKFLEGLLQYYIEQADSYNQFANEYSKFSSSKGRSKYLLLFTFKSK